MKIESLRARRTLGCLLVVWICGASGGERAEEAALLEGHVLTADGAPVAGAIVRLTDPGGGYEELVADARGAFRRPGLAAGVRCAVEVRGGGTPRTGARTISPRPGQRLHLDLIVAGQAMEDSISLIDDPGAATITRLDAGFIDALPILGHDYQDALTLAPGVDDPDGDGNPSVRGARDTGLVWRLDRSDTTDPASGRYGMNLAPLAIESLDVITAGAPAEHGRFSGGVAKVTSRSGDDEIEGRFAFYWRGRFLDGARGGDDDVISFDEEEVAWRDLRAAAAVGGPIRKERLWYFITLEGLNTEEPTGQAGEGSLIRSRGVYGLGKLSWQVDGVHRLGLQVSADPRHFEGLGLPPLSSGDSGYSLEQRGVDAQLHWTAAMSREVLLEASVTRFESGVDVEPDSRFFRPTSVTLVSDPTAAGGVAARYPCSVINCDEAAGERSIYQVDGSTGRVTGPYYQRSDDERDRLGVRADFTRGFEARGGSHRVKAGFELADESLRSERTVNPILYDQTAPYSFAPPGSNQVSGYQLLSTVGQSERQRKVDGFATGLYISDSWKPLSNLAIVGGLRFDTEDLDAPGWEPFDPLRERRRSVVLWRAICEEAARQGFAGSFSNCSPLVPYNGEPPSGLPPSSLRSYRDQDMNGVNDVPAEVAALDLNGDGIIETIGVEGAGFFKRLTTLQSRDTRTTGIEDGHFSPRIGISWDPWSDGRTRLYAHWGRYYDRIPLDTALADSEGASTTFTFIPNASTRVIAPGSRSSATTRPTILQLSHRLRTPRTDELSVGFERALGASWSVGGGYIRRRAEDLLQDVDLNHYTCRQSGEAIGIDPVAVCGSLTGALLVDRFGSSPPPFASPNGIEDLYAASAYFNRVLRLDNLDRSNYRAYEVTLVRRNHRNWQMQAGYTWSEARGQAASPLSVSGDDPSAPRDAGDWLDYDRRHRLKVQGVAHLPAGIVLGGAVAWESGSPWSIAVTSVADLDSSGNAVPRYLLPTGRANDQRNEGIWKLDARIEKQFTFGRIRAGGFILAENLLDSDDLVIYKVEPDGRGLVAARAPGRRFEAGATLSF